MAKNKRFNAADTQDEFVKAVFGRIEESKENRFIAKEDKGKVSPGGGNNLGKLL